jgi:hypothetical protein
MDSADASLSATRHRVAPAAGRKTARQECAGTANHIGPASYGKIPLHFTQRADALKYRVGYLFGVSDAANNSEAIAQLEYELHF